MAEEAKEGGDGAEAPEQAPKKLNLASIGLAVQAVVMLAVVGVIAKVVFMTPKPDLTQNTLEERVIASIRDESEDIQHLPVEELIAKIDEEKTIKAEIVLELSNSEIRQILESRSPIIRSRILQVLSGQKFSKVDRIQGKLELKDRLVHILNEELAKANYQGTGTVRDIYFVNLLLI